MRFSALRQAAVLAAPVLLLSLSEVARAADAIMEDGVMVVTGDTIEQAIKDHSHLVVEFYAPCEFRSSSRALHQRCPREGSVLCSLWHRSNLSRLFCREAGMFFCSPSLFSKQDRVGKWGVFRLNGQGPREIQDQTSASVSSRVICC